MARIDVDFLGCGSIWSKTGAGEEEWLTAMVYFDLSADDEPLGMFMVDMKLTQGSAAEIESVEVGPSKPLGEGPHEKRSIPHGPLADAAREYLLRVVNAPIPEPGDLIERFRTTWSTSFEADDFEVGGW